MEKTHDSDLHPSQPIQPLHTFVSFLSVFHFRAPVRVIHHLVVASAGSLVRRIPILHMCNAVVLKQRLASFQYLHHGSLEELS